MDESWAHKVKSVRELGLRGAAKEIGCNHGTLHRVLTRALNKASDDGYVPQMPPMIIANNKRLGKVTTQADAQGNIKQIWYRQSDLITALEDSLEELFNSLEITAPTIPKPKVSNSDILTTYNIGDMHIAMHSWHEETGTDFDIDIATGDLLNALADLIGRALPSEKAIILNLGDAIHFHDNTRSTKASGNPLDADSRVDKAFRVTCILMNKFVEMALKKHKEVIVRNVLGNHDEELAMALRYQMHAYWRNEKRVIIEMTPSDTWFYEFGKCMLMATHGHNMKPDKMIPYMSAKMPEMWGRCKLRRALHGHFHSKSIVESLGGKAEGFSNLAPNDAWHESKGYLSELECVSITYHKCGKEVGRQNFMIHHSEVGNSNNSGMMGKI